MLFRNSMKKLLRTPLKTLLFLALLCLSTSLLAIGLSLWNWSGENLRKMAASFHTVGTVSQTQDSLKTEDQWDGIGEKYFRTDQPVFKDILPVSVFDKLPANLFLARPEKRPLYYADTTGSGLKFAGNNSNFSVSQTISILEFRALKSGVPSKPMQVLVTKVLFGKHAKAGEKLNFCDHFNPHPSALKAGKEYICTCQSLTFQHKGLAEMEENNAFPVYGIRTEQNGQMERTPVTADVQEVTPGFDKTKEAKAYLGEVATLRRTANTIPVTATNSLELLQAFHLGEAVVTVGSTLTEQDFASGNRVCLIPQEVAFENNLKPGDKIPLNLFAKDTENAASQVFSSRSILLFDCLTEKGRVFPVFQNTKYTVKGFYREDSTGGNVDYQMGPMTVIVPAKSVKENGNTNLAASGPMQGGTTSFEIPNGTIDRFMDEFSKLGLKNLHLQFYDGGYTQLEGSMENTRRTALFLMLAGLVSALGISALFVHLSIGKQKREAAVERSLGLTKRRCAASMASGLLVVAVVGTLLGAVAGSSLTEFALKQIRSDDTAASYSTVYSAGTSASHSEENSKPAGTAVSPGLAGASAGCVLLAVFAFSGASIHITLKREPLELLQDRKN